MERNVPNVSGATWVLSPFSVSHIFPAKLADGGKAGTGRLAGEMEGWKDGEAGRETSFLLRHVVSAIRVYSGAQKQRWRD